MTPLLACPICSSPPMMSRPLAIKGATSGVFFLLAGFHCTHIRLQSPTNRDEESAEPLIARWNEWAAKKAAEESQRLGHTPDQAATFLSRLRERSYTEDRWEA